MKVIISVGGKFHAFHLARELLKRKYLKRIFTAYPYFKLKGEEIPKEKIISLPNKTIFERLVSKLPFLRKSTHLPYYACQLYDRQVARRIDDCDIFVGWSSFSLSTLKKIRESSRAKIIIERGSPHIEHQRQILLEESELTGLKLEIPGKRVVDKELEEYRLSDYISVPSTYAEGSFIKKGFPQDKLIRVAYGVDTRLFSPSPKQDEKFRVIFVGLRLIKGLYYFLRAIEQLKLKDSEVWLIGAVGYDAERILRRYLGPVKYIGAVPQRQMHKYYSQGSVFVVPSLDDGFSLAVLEAMACGLPVICSVNTGAKDAIRDTRDGFLIPARSVEAIKEKINYLYQHRKTCKEMGEEARLRVQSGFSWEDYGSKITDIYEKIIKK